MPRHTHTPQGASTQAKAVDTLAITPGQRVRMSVSEVRERLGGKQMAEYFDGRTGDDVSKATISRWESGERRFDFDNLPMLVALDPELGSWFLRSIPRWMGLHERVLEQLPPKEAQHVREAFERVLFEEIAPGRYGRRS